jgi:hypothetical protein
MTEEATSHKRNTEDEILAAFQVTDSGRLLIGSPVYMRIDAMW